MDEQSLAVIPTEFDLQKKENPLAVYLEEAQDGKDYNAWIKSLNHTFVADGFHEIEMVIGFSHFDREVLDNCQYLVKNYHWIRSINMKRDIHVDEYALDGMIHCEPSRYRAPDHEVVINMIYDHYMLERKKRIGNGKFLEDGTFVAEADNGKFLEDETLMIEVDERIKKLESGEEPDKIQTSWKKDEREDEWQ